MAVELDAFMDGNGSQVEKRPALRMRESHPAVPLSFGSRNVYLHDSRVCWLPERGEGHGTGEMAGRVPATFYRADLIKLAAAAGGAACGDPDVGDFTPALVSKR